MYFKDFLIESEESDEWLQKWVHAESGTTPSKAIIDDLLHDHPFDSNSALYRGLNFRDEDHYRSFLKDTQNGTVLHTTGMTSWTTDVHNAENFSVTRPTYFLNKSLLQAEDVKRRNRDYMIGHAGIILKVMPARGTGIDVSSSGKGAENEVVLIPGTYKISIHKTNIPFVSSINDENYEEVLQSMGSVDEGFNKQKLEHILFRFADFSRASREKLWNLIKFRPNITTNVQYDKDATVDNKGVLYANMNANHLALYFYSWLLPEHQQIIRSALKKSLSNLSKQIHDITKEDDFDYSKLRIRFDRDIKLAQLITGIDIFKHVDHHLANLYHDMNKYSNLQDINKLPHEEKIRTIKQFSDDLVNLLKNLQRQ
jgi:hypothetical protein